MSMGILSPEEYEEPRCPLCSPHACTPIPLRRVTDKLDEYLSQKDFAAAERHVRYWLDEAEAGGDRRGKLSLLNEAIGFYRKIGRETPALAYAETAIRLAGELGLEDSVTMGTTLLNAATAQEAFGHIGEAQALYRRARVLYEKHLAPGDERLGGLYNNMALAYSYAGDHNAAQELFHKALTVVEHLPDGASQAAITYCNLADVAHARKDAAAVGDCLERAMACFRRCEANDPDAAYACEKCAPVFAQYGFAAYADELTRRAEGTI